MTGVDLSSAAFSVSAVFRAILALRRTAGAKPRPSSGAITRQPFRICIKHFLTLRTTRPTWSAR
jgi:hypothetical protein